MPNIIVSILRKPSDTTRKEKSEWFIGNLARDVIQWLKTQDGEVLVIEDLDISDQGNGSPAFNRRTVPFSHRQLAETLTRRALREGLAVKRVNPAYTSWIEQLKYAPQYGISRHVAAAYVIRPAGYGATRTAAQTFDCQVSLYRLACSGRY